MKLSGPVNPLMLLSTERLRGNAGKRGRGKLATRKSQLRKMRTRGDGILVISSYYGEYGLHYSYLVDLFAKLFKSTKLYLQMFSHFNFNI